MFRPSLVHFAFTDQEDAGSVVHSGLHKGEPRSFGSASYRVPPHVAHRERLKHLADIFAPMLPRLREAGATEWQVWVARYFHAQCNEEFSPEELKQLVRLDCTLCYSAYPVTAAEEKVRRKDLGYP